MTISSRVVGAVKAFHVPCNEYGEDSLLIFAESPSKAKYMAQNAGLWDYGGYENIRIRRIPKFDDLAASIGSKVIETNDDLPKGREYYDESDHWRL